MTATSRKRGASMKGGEGWSRDMGVSEGAREGRRIELRRAWREVDYEKGVKRVKNGEKRHKKGQKRR